MKILSSAACASFLLLFLAVAGFSQGDVRSATGLPIPIGEPVIWGQVELKGLKPNETRPTVFVTLIIQGSHVARTQTNDGGFYVFRGRRVTDGAMLQVTVGGVDVGRQLIQPGSGDRYDMVLDWSESSRPGTPGVVSAKNLYQDRSEANEKVFGQASAAAKSKDRATAIRLFNQIVAADPKDFVAWTELGSVYFEDGKNSDAAAAYEKAIALKPDYMVALMNLGKLHFAGKSFTEAAAVFQKAATVDNTSADAFEFLGESLLQMKQGSKAVAILNEAIRLQPMEKADIHLRLATLYHGAKLNEMAVNEYKLFLQKKPNHPEKAKLEKYIKDNSK